MFKKLKDKITEEVKSSPQRIQQFAQAAQAAVTSASSSISDITNNDLFSIGDNDSNHSRNFVSGSNQKSPFHDVSLVQQQSEHTSSETLDTASFTPEETARQRRLSNSSFASDISFRLPTYESPSMYHLQSDMDVSASEAEEKGFNGGTVNLDRVTKEQLYSAYRRTQDRCTKYKTQYADLARHYKFLERENAKARNVLVETQDKALRRMSELREQCTLEQSAKAHIEKALRMEIEERNMKIDTLNMKLNILQGNKDESILDAGNKNSDQNDSSQLIDLSLNDEQEIIKTESMLSEITVLNNKVSKMEQLVNKYKESLKVCKEKNAQIITEVQILTTDLENKSKENELLKITNTTLDETKHKIDELNGVIEKMHNSYKTLEFSKNKEISVLKLDLEQAHEIISQLNNKVEGLSKREEEYAISLAENKLSIHKELETKEAEIKSLKDSLTISHNEIQSLNIVVSDYKNTIQSLEEEQYKHSNSINELNKATFRIKELELQLDELTKKWQSIENCKAKLEEEYNCLELQLKQETAEKLAMIDRNTYLENRNTQLSEESLKKSTQINKLESDIKLLIKKEESCSNFSAENDRLVSEVDKWKSMYIQLESEIQEEREELVKLQTEIDKLLHNHESVRNENITLHAQFMELEKKKQALQVENEKIKSFYNVLLNKIKSLQNSTNTLKKEMKISTDELYKEMKENVKETLHLIVSSISKHADKTNNDMQSNINSLQKDLKTVTELYETKMGDLQEQIKQYEDLQLKQIQEVKDCESLKKTLNDNVEEHEVVIREMITLKNEKQNLSDTLKVELDLKNDCIEKIKRLKLDNSTLMENIEGFKKENLKLKEESDKLTSKFEQIVEVKSTLERYNQSMIENIETLKIDNITLLNENTSLERKCTNLNSENQNLLQKINENQVKIDQLESETEKLHSKIEYLNSEYCEMESIHQKTLKQLQDSNSSTANEKIKILQDAKIELEVENKKIEEELLLSKLNYSNLVTENKNLQSKLEKMIEQNAVVESDNNTCLKELNVIKDSNIYLQEKVNIMKKQNEDIVTSFEALTRKNDGLKKKIEDYDLNILHCQELENEIKSLKTENATLTNQCVVISNNMKDLQIEMLQVCNSHEEIEKEKDNLCSILRNLENNKLKHELGVLNTQNRDQDSNVEVTEKSPFQHLSDNSTQNVDKDNDVDDKTTDFILINTTNSENKPLEHEYGLLKEENRRLRSDIEGLQSYLTKISKENTHLNDKLREVITSNDNFTDQNELSLYDIEALKNEIQSGKDKIDNLTRENTLLIEENLELKDQINFHSFHKSLNIDEIKDENKNVNEIDDKYNNLLDSKKCLEKRVNELEYINVSINSNMQEMQDKNEKLRLANDKLGRRLDEALVSLRHLHSLEENTELEYLRNILYEYLTGSGTHSLTLAKVLSAVVKFNESQTEHVLQKEKERQGVLRHLGII